MLKWLSSLLALSLLFFSAPVFADSVFSAGMPSSDQPIGLVDPNWKPAWESYQEAPAKAPVTPTSDPVSMGFTGLANQEPVLEFYSGGYGGSGSGPGPDFGAKYTRDSLALIANDAGGTGNFTNNPTGDTIVFFLDGDSAILTVEEGFTTGFSFYYSAAFEPGVVIVYSGLAGQGDELARLELPVTPRTGDTPYPWDNWEPFGVEFDGTAKSIAFGGVRNRIGFDNITLFSEIPVDPEISLAVNSSGAEAVRITASPDAYGGTTNYTIRDLSYAEEVTLTAPAMSNGAIFLNWEGCDETDQDARTCMVEMTDDKSVTAFYGDQETHSLDVNSVGATAVQITASPAAYGGTTNYTAFDIPGGTLITLTAPAASNGANFETWSGCDEASDAARTCRVTMTTDKSVTARYGTQEVGSALYFPHIATDGPWRSEIGIINSGQTQLTGTLRGFTGTGQEVHSEPVTLPVYGRMGQNVTQTDINYMRLDITSGMAVGFQKFWNPALYRVGLEAVARPLQGPLYVPHIASDDIWWTGIAAVNTVTTGNATKNLQFIFNDGRQATESLGAGHHKAFPIRAMFDGPQPGLRSARVNDAAGLVGLQLFGSEYTLSGFTFGNETARRLVFPHIHVDDVWWTGYGIYNTTPNAATLDIKVYSAQGGPPLYQTTATVTGHSNMVSAFGEGQLPPGSAWFTIEATQPVIGFQLFGSVGSMSANQLAGYSVVNLGTREGVFPKIDHAGWTGIAFVNSSGEPTTVRLEARGNDGQLVATQFMQLAAGQKEIKVAQDFFTASIETATWIAYHSTREIVGFQLNGSNDSVMLDAIPALRANFTPHNPFDVDEDDVPEDDGE